MNNLEIYEQGIEKVLKENNFDELNGKSILIVGSNGLIGSAIVDVLNYLNKTKKFNINIFATVRNKLKTPKRFSSYKNLKIIEYDVTEKLELNEHIDYIINSASHGDPKNFSNSPANILITNFLGTKNLLDFAMENNSKRLLYISSGEIYGQGGSDITSFYEDYSGYINSTNVRSCYPLGKLASENLCVSYHQQYNIETVIVRPCHTYGPTQTNSDSRVSAQFVNNVLDNKDIVMKSEGSQIRSYCYVLDCVTGILTTLISGISGEAYNIANKDSILSIREMAEMIAKLSNKKVIFDIPNESEKKGYNPVTRSVLNPSKLEKIGWKPCFEFKNGIKETLKIMK